MKYYTDGFVRGSNPSKYGGGFTIVDENNNLIRREEIEQVGFTNNEGEMLGIIYACTIALLRDVISTDSMCCLTWAHKGKSKARPDLNELMARCKKLIEDKELNLIWERRNFNLAGIYNEQEVNERKNQYLK